MSYNYRVTLKAARVNAGYTSRDAARMLGVSAKTLLAWENGKHSPKAIQVQSICDLYKIPLDLLSF